VKIDPDAMAFPQPMAENPFGTTQTAFEKHPDFGGLSIRAHFASLAMQASVSAMTPAYCEAVKIEAEKHGITESRFIARMAIEHADSLIAELNK